MVEERVQLTGPVNQFQDAEEHGTLKGFEYANMILVQLPHVQAAIYFLGALFCFLGALNQPSGSTPGHTLHQVQLGLVLSGLASLAAAYFSYLEFGVRLMALDKKRASAAGLGPSQWLQGKTTIKEETAVDMIRIIALLVVGPFVILRLYLFSGNVMGNIFDSRGVVLLLHVIGVAVYGVQRASFDPASTNFKSWEPWVVLAGLGSVGLTVYVLIFVDLMQAADKLRYVPWLQATDNVSFVCFISVGYAVMLVGVFIAHVLTKMLGKKGEDYTKFYPKWLRLVKDVGHAVLGVMVLGFLTYGSALAAYGSPFKDTVFFPDAASIATSLSFL